MEYSTVYSKPHSFPLSSSPSHLLPVSAFLRRRACCFIHPTRVHGVRFQRRCGKLGHQSRRSDGFTTQSALGDGGIGVDTVLVSAAAVAALIGIGAFYLDNERRRDREAEFSVSETPDVVATDQLESIYEMENGVWGCQTMSLQSGSTSTLSKGDEGVISSSDVKSLQNMEFSGDILMYDGVLMSTMIQEAEHDSCTPTTCKEIEIATSEGSSLLFHAEAITGALAANSDNISEISAGKEKPVNLSLGSKTIAQSSLVILNDMLAQVIDDRQHVDGMAVEGECIFPRSDEQIAKSDEEASEFCKEQPAFDFKFLCQIPQHFTLEDNFGIGSGASSANKAKLTESGSLISSDDSKELMASITGGSKITNSKNLTGDRRKRVTKQVTPKNLKKSKIQKQKGVLAESSSNLLHQNQSWKKARHSEPSLKPLNETTDPSSCLSLYNDLLRYGRLNGCIELLENMESRGLLDMDKVYHTRFLKACKSQKAVKEAFCFTKLIKKPNLSTFNMLLSVCASSEDYEGALQVLLLVKEAGLRPDCQLYTTLITTCGKSGKVDAMFEVYHEMVNAGAEPTVHTYGALIDGCARARQVAKAFGAYGIMRSKNVNPDRVIFNALITACGQSGAVDRAFDVLAEMMAEPQPIDPDHVTVGALIKTCIQAGQANRALEVYKMLQKYKIKGDQEVYTIAVHCCSLTGDLDFALTIFEDMKQHGIEPDEMFLSTLVDVAGHAGNADVGFEILNESRRRGLQLGNMSYSSLMGACSNAKNWKKALELYEELKALKLCPTVSTLNALITSLCDGDQLMKAIKILDEMKVAGVQPNTITYTILLVACERKDKIESAFKLFSQAEEDGILLNLIMSQCLIGLCMKRFEQAYILGEPIFSNSAKPEIISKWTTWAITAYRKTISAGIIPSTEAFSQVLGCLKFPNDNNLRNRFVENLGIGLDTSSYSNAYSLLDGFGEYDPRSFSLFEEASSLGVVPCVSFKESPIVVDVRKLQIHTAQVYLLTTLKGLKHRLAAGARLPNITILLPTERTTVLSTEGDRTINVAGRVGRAVGAMLRRLGLPYQGDESYGKVRISGLSLRRWFKPKVTFPSFIGKPIDLTSSQSRLAKEITNQQRDIRSNYNLSLE